MLSLKNILTLIDNVEWNQALCIAMFIQEFWPVNNYCCVDNVITMYNDRRWSLYIHSWQCTGHGHNCLVTTGTPGPGPAGHQLGPGHYYWQQILDVSQAGQSQSHAIPIQLFIAGQSISSNWFYKGNLFLDVHHVNLKQPWVQCSFLLLICEL